MKKLVLMFAIAGAVLPSAGQAGPPKRVAAKQVAYSIDTAIRDLLKKPASRAVLAKHMPGLVTSDHLSMFQNMSIRQLAASPHARIPQSKIDAVAADLAKLK